MRAHLATADQFYGSPSFKSLTPQGWSGESEKIRSAEDEWISGYYDVPASRLHLHEIGDQPLELLIAVQDLNDIIGLFRGRLAGQVRDRIRKRISVLTDPADWNVEDGQPNSESFRLLLTFLAGHGRLRYPSIFLNRYGLFTASWRPEERKLASLVFHVDGCVNWLVFSPREDDVTEVTETAGRSSSATVLKEVGKHGALKWMRRPTRLVRLLGNV